MSQLPKPAVGMRVRQLASWFATSGENSIAGTEGVIEEIYGTFVHWRTDDGRTVRWCLWIPEHFEVLDGSHAHQLTQLFTGGAS